MRGRTGVRLDRGAVDRIVDRAGASGAEATARFLADEQRNATRSRRLAGAVVHESGRDARGWYARAGMSSDRRAFFWVFEEYETGRGGGKPFIRPSLLNNTGLVARMMVRGR